MSDIRRSSEAEPGPAAGAALSAATRATGTTAADDADDDLLAFLEIASLDLGRRAVRDAERDLDGDRLAVRTGHEHASGRARTAFRRHPGHLVVFRLLLGRQERADLLPAVFAD